MMLEPTAQAAALFEYETQSTSAAIGSEPPRIELMVDGPQRPVCVPNRVLLDSGRFWNGYRLEWIRAPATGVLERVSTPVIGFRSRDVDTCLEATSLFYLSPEAAATVSGPSAV